MGCESAAPDAALVGPALQTAVVGNAAADLDASGLFQLPTTKQADDEISGTDASRLANAWVHQYGPFTQSFLESTHRGSVHFKALSPCGRALYARSAFSPSSDLPIVYRRTYGSWWLVTFCEASVPSVSVAVSAWATDLTVTGGKLIFPPISGNEFFAIGIPPGVTAEYPVSPEEAVRLAVQQTGAEVSSVPELIMPVNSDGPPQAARWHLQLAQPTTFNRTEGSYTTKDVYVALDMSVATVRVVVPTATQVDEVDVSWRPPPSVGETASGYRARVAKGPLSTRLERKQHTPTRFEPARPEGL